MKTYWHENKEVLQQKAKDRNEKQREPARILVQAILETTPCVDCGIDDWRVLEFDHVRGEKWRNICDIMLYPLDIIEAEIDKCDVVCANCHKIRTFKRAGSWRFSFNGNQ